MQRKYLNSTIMFHIKRSSTISIALKENNYFRKYSFLSFCFRYVFHGQGRILKVIVIFCHLTFYNMRFYILFEMSIKLTQTHFVYKKLCFSLKSQDYRFDHVLKKLTQVTD